MLLLVNVHGVRPWVKLRLNHINNFNVYLNISLPSFHTATIGDEIMPVKMAIALA
jgi:hypothetical protein